MSATRNRKIFTELTALWKSISALHSQDTSVDHNNISKGQTTTYINTQDKNITEMSPRSHDTPRHHASVHQPRPSLAPIDTNAINEGGIFGRKISPVDPITDMCPTETSRKRVCNANEPRWAEGTSNQRRKHARTLHKKAQKKKKSSSPSHADSTRPMA